MSVSKGYSKKNYWLLAASLLIPFSFLGGCDARAAPDAAPDPSSSRSIRGSTAIIQASLDLSSKNIGGGGINSKGAGAEKSQQEYYDQREIEGGGEPSEAKLRTLLEGNLGHGEAGCESQADCRHFPMTCMLSPSSEEHECSLAGLPIGDGCDINSQCGDFGFCNSHFVCEAKRASGQSCLNSNQCESGLWCDQSAVSPWEVGVCAATETVMGGSCDTSQPAPSLQCGPNLRCDNETNTCLESLQEGQECIHDHDCLQSSSSCTRLRADHHFENGLSSDSVNHTASACLRKGEVGDPCVRDEECYSLRCTENYGILELVGYCFDGTSIPYSSGGACVYDTDCSGSDGLVCCLDTHTCLRGIDQACSTDTECAFDWVCTIGMCKRDDGFVSDCKVSGVDGFCHSAQDWGHRLLSMLQNVMGGKPSVRLFLKIFFDIFEFLLIDLTLPDKLDLITCFGDFTGKEIQQEAQQLGEVGCDAIPTFASDEVDFGVVALHFPLFEKFIAWFRAAGRWIEEPGKALYPSFCFVYRFPKGSCSDLVLGMSINSDMLRVIGNLMAGTNVGEFIVAITRALKEAKIKVHFGVGLGFGDALQKDIMHLRNKQFRRTSIPLHLSFQVIGKKELTKGPDWWKIRSAGDFFEFFINKLVDIEGSYTKAWNLENLVDAVETGYGFLTNDAFVFDKWSRLVSLKSNDFQTDIVDLYSALHSVASVDIITTGIILNLGFFSYDLLPKVVMVDFQSNTYTVPSDTDDFPTGYYFGASSYCSFLDFFCELTMNLGSLVGIGSTKCPNFLATSGKREWGFSLTLSKIEFGIDTGLFSLFCKLSYGFEFPENLEFEKTDLSPTVQCKFDEKLFAYIMEGAKWVVGKIEDFFEDDFPVLMSQVGATVSRAVVSLYGGMSDEAKTLAKLSSQASKKAKKFVLKYYNKAENLVGDLVDTADELTGGNNKRVVTSFNFVKDKKCEGTTIELFNSRAWNQDNVDVNGYHENGGDDTRLDCFRECVEYMSLHVDGDPDLTTSRDDCEHCPSGVCYNETRACYEPCCAYEKMNSGNYRSCSVGFAGKDAVNDVTRSASTVFMADFERMKSLNPVGDACIVDSQCDSGTCLDNVCVEECFSFDMCWPDENQICFYDDDACFNAQGLYHYCSVIDNKCHACDDADGPPASEIPEGLYRIRVQRDGRYWYMQDEDKKVISRSPEARDGTTASNQYKFDFEIRHQPPGSSFGGPTRHYIKNFGQHKWLQGKPNGDIEGIATLDPREGSTYFTIEPIGNCQIYKMSLRSDGTDYHIVNNDNNRIKMENHVSSDSDMLFAFQRIGDVTELLANGQACSYDVECSSQYCSDTDGVCKSACGSDYQCEMGQQHHHCHSASHCSSTGGGAHPFCDIETRECSECPHVDDPSTGVAQGNYYIRSQDSGSWWYMLGNTDSYKTVGHADLNPLHDAGYVWEVHNTESEKFYFRNIRREKILRINDGGVSTGQNTVDDRMRFALEAPGDCDMFTMKNGRDDFVYQNDVGTIRGSRQNGQKEYFSFIPLDGNGESCSHRSECFSNRCFRETCRLECGQQILCSDTTLHHYCSDHATCDNFFFCNSDHQCEPQRDEGRRCGGNNQCLSGFCHGDDICMIECSSDNPCPAGDYYHCGGHGQCDESTAYCDSNHCASKKADERICAGHTSCLSGWCADEGGQRRCRKQKAPGLGCDEHESCITGLCAQDKCMWDCNSDDPCGPSRLNRCNGHNQCDATAYCHPQESYCESKEENGDPCTGHPVCKSDYCANGVCTPNKDVGEECGGHQSCITNSCQVNSETGKRVCMVDCSTSLEPCAANNTNHCGGHGQCDGATAYCKDHQCFSPPGASSSVWICPVSTCELKIPNGDPCAGHTSCLSGWCKDGICTAKIPKGRPCEGHQSCETGLCAQNRCMTDCSASNPCPAGYNNRCNGHNQCREGVFCNSTSQCEDLVELGSPCGGDNQCSTGLCATGGNGTDVCMTNCNSTNPCQAAGYNQCGGHGQCDDVTAYCKDYDCFLVDPEVDYVYTCPASTCALKKVNGTECDGHYSCLSGWCKQEAGERFCENKILKGKPCEGHQSCETGLCAQGKCMTDCSASNPCPEGEDNRCHGHNQCMPGVFCNSTNQCEDLRELGSECGGDNQCLSQHCRGRDGRCTTDCSVHGPCVANFTNHCNGHNQCDNDSFCYDYYCKKLLEPGKNCSGDNQCDSGICRDTNPEICLRDCTVDEPCEAAVYNRCNGHNQCDATAYCDSDRCVAKKSNGTECDGHESCTSGLLCRDELDGRGRVCGAALLESAPCTRHDSCVTGLCAQEMCMWDCNSNDPCGPSRYNRCNGHNQCNATAYCHPQSYCAKKKDVGEPCTGHPVCKSDYCARNQATGRDECAPSKDIGEKCRGHESCISNVCEVDVYGERVCMVDCSTLEPCAANETNHCGGHGQCDGATAYCKDHDCSPSLSAACPASTCALKKVSGTECDGHYSCLSGWCKEEAGERFCENKILKGKSCEGHQSCETGLCAQGKCMTDCSASNPCPEGEDNRCHGHNQCMPGVFCNSANQCEDLRELGSDCGGDNQCLSGFCHSGKCMVDCSKDGPCVANLTNHCGGHGQCDYQSAYCERSTDTCADKVELGMPCSESAECKDDKMCHANICKTDCSKSPCMPGQDEGLHHCGGHGQCEEGAYCKKQCYDQIEDGRACGGDKQCQSGICRDATPKICLRDCSKDGPCEAAEYNRCGGHNQCVSTAFCYTNTDITKPDYCKKKYRNGLSCGGDEQCQSGICRDATPKICLRDCSKDGPCEAAEYNRCGGHNQCVSTAFCYTNTDITKPDYCKQKYGNGSPCGGHNQCKSNLCHGGKCKTDCSTTNRCSADRWTRCGGHNQCVSTAFCYKDYCKKKKRNGSSCGGNNQCKSNFCHGDRCKTDCSASNRCSADRWTRCSGHNQCVSTAFCYNDYCKQKYGNGSSCGGDNQCKSNFCHNGKCKTDCSTSNRCAADRWTQCGGHGECKRGSCPTGQRCADNAYCKDDSYCAERFVSGETCGGDNQCQSGNCKKRKCT